jgi:hypothetical protein
LYVWNQKEEMQLTAAKDLGRAVRPQGKYRDERLKLRSRMLCVDQVATGSDITAPEVRVGEMLGGCDVFMKLKAGNIVDMRLNIVDFGCDEQVDRYES